MCLNITIFGWLLIKTELFWSTLLLTMDVGIENKNIFLRFLIDNMFLETETKWIVRMVKAALSLRSIICHD